MKKIQSGVYGIKNTFNNKIYIGSSVNVKKRFSEHLRELRKGIHNNKHLQNAYTKYTEVAFEFVILEEVEDKTKLITREQFWINHIDACNTGYNKAPTAGSRLGAKHSDETRKKISEARSGKKYGPLSEEHKKALSESKKGRTRGPMSEETKQKLREANMGKKCDPMSEEQKEKLRFATTSYFNGIGGEEARQKQREAAMAYYTGPNGEEARQKHSQTMKGRKKGPMGEETKQKISKALKNNQNAKRK